MEMSGLDIYSLVYILLRYAFCSKSSHSQDWNAVIYAVLHSQVLFIGIWTQRGNINILWSTNAIYNQ